MTTKALEYNATIIHKTLLTPTLAIFRVRHDDPIASFIPGQYAIIGLNHPEKGGVMRPYSIASAPYLHGEYLEFYIRYVNQPTSDNPLTHLLFKVEEGDRLMMRPKIQGHFTEEKCMGKEDRRLRILVAAGTGLAPFTSMVFEHQHQTGEPGPYAIVHGASYPVDLGYREELEGLLNRPGGAPRYAATISRPSEASDWSGLVGRAEAHFEPDRLGDLEEFFQLGRGGLNPQNCTVMICGLQGTIANTLTALFHRGFVPADRRMRREFGIPADCDPSIFFEQYDTTPILDLKNEELKAQMIDRLKTAGVPLEDAPVSA